jgi:hypothetical protein
MGSPIRLKESRSGQTKDYKIGICCFSSKHAALRSKSKDWLARNQNNVSEWNNISTRGLLFQWGSTIKIQLSVLCLSQWTFFPWTECPLYPGILLHCFINLLTDMTSFKAYVSVIIGRRFQKMRNGPSPSSSHWKLTCSRLDIVDKLLS